MFAKTTKGKRRAIRQKNYAAELEAKKRAHARASAMLETQLRHIAVALCLSYGMLEHRRELHLEFLSLGRAPLYYELSEQQDMLNRARREAYGHVVCRM